MNDMMFQMFFLGGKCGTFVSEDLRFVDVG